MRLRWAIAALAVVAMFTVGACRDATPSTADVDPPAVKGPADEDGLSRITLSASAFERLGIEVDAIAGSDDGTDRLVMPYGALIYDPDGSTWAYTSPADLVYVRAPLTIDRIDGDDVLLIAGPEVGTRVVSVGAAELYGFEHGIGK